MNTIYCLIDYSKALLTPLIAIIAAGIAYQQWITSRNQFRLNYFDKRLAVYTATMEFIAGIISSGVNIQENSRIFLVKTREAKFLFDEEIEIYLLDLYQKSEQYRIKTETLQKSTSLSNSEREKIILETGNLYSWISEQHNVPPIKFKKYLKIEDNPLHHMIQSWRKRKRIHQE